MINHCESDPSKTQSSLELRDGRSERERLQRGWRKRERVCSHSEREKRYKGREANLRERSRRRAEGRWGRHVSDNAARPLGLGRTLW